MPAFIAVLFLIRCDGSNTSEYRLELYYSTDDCSSCVLSFLTTIGDINDDDDVEGMVTIYSVTAEEYKEFISNYPVDMQERFRRAPEDIALFVSANTGTILVYKHDNMIARLNLTSSDWQKDLMALLRS